MVVNYIAASGTEWQIQCSHLVGTTQLRDHHQGQGGWSALPKDTTTGTHGTEIQTGNPPVTWWTPTSWANVTITEREV